MSAEAPVNVLLVCTGNVCRSPMAERLLVAGMALRRGCTTEQVREWVDVTSAGTAALSGEPMTPQMRALVAAAGGDPDQHAARMLSDDLLLRADVVLALTREHRAAVLTRRPQLLRSTFTLREAARLAAASADGNPIESAGVDLPQAWRDLPSRLHRARGLERRGPDADDVIDPYGRSRKTYARAGRQIVEAVHTVLEAVAPAAESSHVTTSG